MANALNEAPSTVQSWKDVERIPATKQPIVLDAARRLGLDVTAEDVVFPMGRPDVTSAEIPTPGKLSELTAPTIEDVADEARKVA